MNTFDCIRGFLLYFFAGYGLGTFIGKLLSLIIMKRFDGHLITGVLIKIITIGVSLGLIIFMFLR